MQARLTERPGVLDRRRETVEHPFGTIKQWMNQGAFLMRGLAKVRAGRADFGAWFSDLLEVEPNDSMLEVGFGPGVVIQHLSKLAPAGHVAGIDQSWEMVEQARARNETAIHRRGPEFAGGRRLRCLHLWVPCLKDFLLEGRAGAEPQCVFVSW
jgi:SAM-dependent methyltransferase